MVAGWVILMLAVIAVCVGYHSLKNWTWRSEALVVASFELLIISIFMLEASGYEPYGLIGLVTALVAGFPLIVDMWRDMLTCFSQKSEK